jgi:hypothetical protein
VLTAISDNLKFFVFHLPICPTPDYTRLKLLILNFAFYHLNIFGFYQRLDLG